MPQDQQGNEVTFRERQTERRHTLSVAIIAGSIGVIGVLLGSVLQLYSAASSQSSEFEEQRLSEDRKQRAEVYFDFLAAATSAQDAALTLDMCLGREQSRTDGLIILRPCADAITQHVRALQEFDTLGYQVFTYGSTEAVRLAHHLSDAVPPRLVSQEDLAGAIPPGQLHKWSQNHIIPEVRERIEQFLELVCSEVPARPREECRVN